MAHGDHESRMHFHNKSHEVITKDGHRHVGMISRVDTSLHEFYLLENDKPGMLGGKTAGKRFSFEECRSVRAESNGNVEGVFDHDMIPEWERWHRQAGVK